MYTVCTVRVSFAFGSILFVQSRENERALDVADIKERGRTPAKRKAANNSREQAEISGGSRMQILDSIPGGALDHSSGRQLHEKAGCNGDRLAAE